MFIASIMASIRSSCPGGPSERQSPTCRKHADEAVQVLNILRCRRALEGWDLVAIDGLPEHEVAKRLAECAIFLSFGYPEGCPLPPLEAMASGCVVVGYHGWGGREYFKPTFSDPIEAGDIIGFARAAEKAIRKGKPSRRCSSGRPARRCGSSGNDTRQNARRGGLSRSGNGFWKSDE